MNFVLMLVNISPLWRCIIHFRISPRRVIFFLHVHSFFFLKNVPHIGICFYSKARDLSEKLIYQGGKSSWAVRSGTTLEKEVILSQGANQKREKNERRCVWNYLQTRNALSMRNSKDKIKIQRKQWKTWREECLLSSSVLKEISKAIKYEPKVW